MSPSPEQTSWFAHFLEELFSMPKRHTVVFAIATVLMIVLEVEFMDGVEVVHVLELIGFMAFLYLTWTAWRVHRVRRSW